MNKLLPSEDKRNMYQRRRIRRALCQNPCKRYKPSKEEHQAPLQVCRWWSGCENSSTWKPIWMGFLCEFFFWVDPFLLWCELGQSLAPFQWLLGYIPGMLAGAGPTACPGWHVSFQWWKEEMGVYVSMAKTTQELMGKAVTRAKLVT